MGWATHLDALRLDQRTWYYLWREDDDLSVDHPLLSAPTGALLHASEADAREIARQHAEPISAKERHTTDLDAALRWSAAPQGSSLDAGLLMTSWYILVDLGALPDPADAHTGTPSQLEEILDKVHWEYSRSGQPSPPPTPVEWTHAELARLAATLQQGIQRLRVNLDAEQSGNAPPAG